MSVLIKVDYGPCLQELTGGCIAGAAGVSRSGTCFPDRIAMRVDEPEHVDMVLGDCARDLGATCELILGRGHRGRGRLSAWKPTRTRCGSVPDGCPTPISGHGRSVRRGSMMRAIKAVAA